MTQPPRRFSDLWMDPEDDPRSTGVEEYARHGGHADLLRERIDGRTGQ
jgi:hypothetical protein